MLEKSPVYTPITVDPNKRQLHDTALLRPSGRADPVPESDKLREAGTGTSVAMIKMNVTHL